MKSVETRLERLERDLRIDEGLFHLRRRPREKDGSWWDQFDHLQTVEIVPGRDEWGQGWTLEEINGWSAGAREGLRAKLEAMASRW